MNSLFKAPIFAVIALVGTWGSLTMAQTKPLLQDGKKSIYQRVLTTPDCLMQRNPTATDGDAVPAFSRYYVYERMQDNGKSWLKVGPDTKGSITGWLEQACTVDWKMQLTLSFSNPADRNPVLFFQNRDTAEQLVDAESPAMAIEPIIQEITATGKAPGVVAKEPALAIAQQKNFYLLPIFEAEELYTQGGDPLRILNVASVSEQESEADPSVGGTNNQATGGNAQSSLKAFSAAVVFVIDSTISMGPYIDRTREAVRSITKQIETAGLGNKVKFGLVAYRGNTDVVPKLEYTSKMYVDPVAMESGDDFLAKIKDLKPATVSTPGFSEDAYAGINTALNDVDWNQFGARYMILITDAGAISGSDDLSTTQLDAAQARIDIKEEGIGLFALHLKTPAGKRNHAIAQSQYEELAFNPIANRSLYYPIEAGSVASFGQKVDEIGSLIAKQVKRAYEGEVSIGSSLTAATADPAVDEMDQLRRDVELIGHAMQLAYLGETQGAKAPSFFKAWVIDRDLANPSRPTMEVKVLITKNQLSDMSAAVQAIVDAANQSHISPTKMFEQLRSVAATMGRDPNQLNQSEQTKLVELGLLGEYLEGLPYKSDVLNLDEETWKSFSATQQQQFVRSLSSKLALYNNFNKDVDRWVSLAPDADPGEDVYPVPLEALP